jgi:hypothetical protein
VSATAAIVGAAAVATAVSSYTAAKKAQRGAQRGAQQQADLDREFAARRAEFIREAGDLRAQLLREQGDTARTIAEYNARIFDAQAEIALALTDRDLRLIGANAAIAATFKEKQYRKVRTDALAAIGATGFTLSGSPIYVLLENAANMDYEMKTLRWSTEVALQNRRIEGDLQAYQAEVMASRERFVGEMERAARYREAALTQRFAELGAEAEITGGEFSAMTAMIQGNAAASFYGSQATAAIISGFSSLANVYARYQPAIRSSFGYA